MSHEVHVNHDVRQGVKLFTHDLRSPFQEAPPVWNGRCPFVLPPVTLDHSAAECAPGWHYTTDLPTAIPIVGLWPDGRPSRAFVVEASADAIQRGNKRRASQLTVIRELSEEEIGASVLVWSQVFGACAPAMAQEQMAWRAALARPLRDPAMVRAGLEASLAVRHPAWSLREYPAASDAWADWSAWGAWDVHIAWGAWGAWDARAAWDAWDAWGAWGAWGAWDARAGWGARAGWDARAALTIFFATKVLSVQCAPDLLTRGIREAYRHGLGCATPVDDTVLGWAMDPPMATP